VREFANQKALVDYAERNGLVYLWEGMPAFARRQLLSLDQYEIVDVRTPRRGVRRAMLFPKAILHAEFAANARCASVWRSSESGCGRSRRPSRKLPW
jgi:hypothetical protein